MNGRLKSQQPDRRGSSTPSAEAIKDAASALRRAADAQRRAAGALDQLLSPTDINFTELDAARAAGALGSSNPSNNSVLTINALLNRAEASRYLGIDPRTFDKHVRSHVQPDPRLPRYSKELLDKWHRKELPRKEDNDRGLCAPSNKRSLSASRTVGSVTKSPRGRQILKLLK